MRRRPSWRALTIVTTLFVGPLAFAADEASIVRVGPVGLSATEISARLAQFPAFQLASLGKTPAEIRRRVVDEFIVPELLLDREVEQRQLSRKPDAASRLQALLARAVVRQVRAEVQAQQPVTPAVVEKYYAAHRKQYVTPHKIRIWRIVVNDAGLAKRIIEKVRAATNVSVWSELVTKHSLDKATHLRKGDLGFVHPSGKTDVPRVVVDKKLYQAAAGVADGELVAEPVPYQGRFAVLWRRGSVAAATVSLKQATPEIERALIRKRVDERLKQLVASLSKRHVKKLNEQLVELVEVPAFADKSTRQRPKPPIRTPPAPAPSATTKSAP